MLRRASRTQALECVCGGRWTEGRILRGRRGGGMGHGLGVGTCMTHSVTRSQPAWTGLHCLQPRNDSKMPKPLSGSMCVVGWRGRGPRCQKAHSDHAYLQPSVYRTKRKPSGRAGCRGFPNSAHGPPSSSSPEMGHFLTSKSCLFHHLDRSSIIPLAGGPPSRLTCVVATSPLPDHSPPGMLFSSTFSTHISTRLPCTDTLQWLPRAFRSRAW